MKEMAYKKEMGLNPPNFAFVSSNIESIAQFHDLLIIDLIQNAKNIGAVFNRFAPYLKLYITYVTDYDKCLSTMTDLKSNSKFLKFLATKREEKDTGGLDLMSFLIMPIQRIPRYELLFRELLSHSRDTDEDYVESQRAYSMVTAIATQVNERKRQAENTVFIQELMKTVTHVPATLVLLQPSRYLIKQGNLTRKAALEEKKEDTVYQFVLFNDLIIWSKLKGKKYKFKGSFTLSEIDFQVMDSARFPFGNTIDVYDASTKSVLITLECSSLEDRNSWVHAFGVCSEYRRGIRDRIKLQGFT